VRPIPTALLLALAVLAALVATAAPAAAAPSQRLLFEAPNELRDPRTRPAALAELESLGVDALRVILYFNDVAPDRDATTRPAVDLTDPGQYAWGEYDAILAAARERGWDVLVTLTGPVPTWATRDRRDKVTRPRADLFEQFVTAAGRRYGEQVASWAVWNEPNLPRFLLPQYRAGTKRDPLSPRIYRTLFQAAEAGLRASGNGDDELLLGETAPRGTTRVVAPLTFLRGTLCLDERYRRDRDCARLDADGYAHHAYTTRVGPFFRPPGRNDVTIGVLPRLTTALDRAARAGAVRPRLPIHLTEFGIQSTPDRVSGVSLTQQPEFRAIAERIAEANPRVRTFSQYLLRDDQPDRRALTVLRRYGGFESGLRFATGRAKPSLSGFRLPLAALRPATGPGRRVELWGKVRPVREPTDVDVLVQDRGRRTFAPLRTVRTDARGTFTLRTAYRDGRRWKLRWREFQGAPVRAYRRGAR
jgi:hypothetical protein